MKCKNCGARLGEDSFVCPNCGADNADDMRLVVDKDVVTANRGKTPVDVEKRRLRIFTVFSIILIIAVAIGSYYYFVGVNNDKDAPAESFTVGAGIINGDQHVVYLAFDDPSLIKYINGVKLYNQDITGKAIKQVEPISTDYEYTKSLDESFRAVFFVLDGMELNPSEQYTYTIELELGFENDERVWTYTQPISFSGNIEQDASDIVFDHSMKENLEQVNN